MSSTVRKNTAGPGGMPSAAAAGPCHPYQSLRHTKMREEMSTAVVVPFAPSPRDAWVADGLRLSHSAKSVMFEIGDWWNNPAVGADRLGEVRSEAWRTGGGLSYGACRVAGSVAKRWPVLSRDNRLSFHHYRFVAKLPDEQAVPLLQWCLETLEPRGPQELNARVKQIKRDAREVALADRIRQESAKIGLQRYGVIYARLLPASGASCASSWGPASRFST
jgi:hypothetical protein